MSSLLCGISRFVCGMAILQYRDVSPQAADPSQAEFVADITSATFPAKFAVRPRLGDQPGPTSDIVELAQARQPTPPIGL